MKIFLGDLVHTWGKISVWTMPINLGFVGGYARVQVSDDLSTRLFKRPERMIEAIQRDKPDVVALSYYVWNINLNRLITQIARKANPDVLLVGGGPVFTSANNNEETARRFFQQQPEIDIFIVNQGERAFAEAMHRFHDNGGARLELLSEALPGALVNDAATNTIRLGPVLDPLRELDVIPSPYLSGMLDEFFEEQISPIIETNRSCPYRCTFCAWGIGTQKLAQFSTERVFAEIDYIAQRKPLSPNWFIADANFSILERDEQIAQRLMNAHEEYGSPQRVIAQWNKTRPDRVLKVARVLKKLTQPGASMQSLNDDSLKAIKRRNLSLEQVTDVINTLNEEGAGTRLFSELIVGLPEETFETHIQANRHLVDLGAEVFNYNLHILPGTEMDTPESRQAYIRQTGYRLHDNAFGIYDETPVFEGQEVVLATPTMSRSEVGDIRFIHFLLQFMWARKHYFDYLHLLSEYGLHPVEAVVHLQRLMKQADGPIGGLYKQFYELYALEEFTTMEQLVDFWVKEENMEMLATGEYGKLNALFTHRIELDYYDEFSAFLLDVAEECLTKSGSLPPERARAIAKDVLDFTRMLKVKISPDQQVIDGGRVRFGHDFLAWRRSNYAKPLNTFCASSDGIEIEFELGADQRVTLERLLEQFRSHNVNLTMRKMSEYSNPELFYYQANYVNAAGRDAA